MVKFLLVRLLILTWLLTSTGFAVFGQFGQIIPSPDSTGTNLPKPYKIEEINARIEKAEKLFNRMSYNLTPDASIKKTDLNFRIYQITIQKEFEETKEFKSSHYSKFVLDNTYFIWSDFNMKLNAWQIKVNTKIKANRKYITELDNMYLNWQVTLKSLEIVDSENVSSRIEAVMEENRKIKNAFIERETELLNLENDISKESTFCTDMVEYVLQLQEGYRDSLFVATSPALWNAFPPKDDYLPLQSKLHDFWHQTTKTFRIYFHSENKTLILILFLFCIILVYSIKYSFPKLRVSDAEAIHQKGIKTILFDHPTLAILALFLISYRAFFPYHPLLLRKLTIVFLILSSQYFMKGFTNKPGKRFFSGLIFLLILNYMQVFFWYFGNVARFYILIEQVIGLVITSHYLKPVFWKETSRDSKLLKSAGGLFVLAFVFYLFSLFGNLFGYFDLGVLFLKVSTHIPAYSVILYGIYKIWIALTGASLLIGKATKQTYLTHYWEKIEKRFLRFVRILLIFFWVYSVLTLFEIALPASLWVTEFLAKKWTIGTIGISIGAILSLMIIIGITFLLTGIIKFIVDDEFIKRSTLPRGITNAISVSVQYFIWIIGLTFALSAAGIDLGKFSLLAGALAVGIGFGLQNIVNNFISGLILVYERPLQVGDTIEVENLMGVVQNIGLRSSHVVTFDGAEVVVPNGNLISNQLINWTLSDNKRRIEVKVGAAYGSDPNLVLRILDEVAKENENILQDPAPLALFEGFGDSSLNFRLLFWVPFFYGLETKSAVSISIYNKFKENNIEIPFPQLDLHVKNKPGETTESLMEK